MSTSKYKPYKSNFELSSKQTLTKNTNPGKMFVWFLAWAWLAKAKGHSCHTKKSTLAKVFTEKNE